MADSDIDQLTPRVLQSKRYRSLYPATVERIVKSLAGRYPPKLLEKAVKKKLHQIWGAYYIRPDFKKLYLKTQQKIVGGETIQESVSSLLMLQASTKERLPILDLFYKEIFSNTAIPKTIIEPACGVNALTYFWLKPSIKYRGFDVDQELIDFINSIYKLTAVNQKAQVELGDILLNQPLEAEMGMLLKVLTILEQQQKGCSLPILKNLKCRYLIVSFPTHSLSGKEKGMRVFYEQWFRNLIRNESWSIKKIEFESELVFAIRKMCYN